MSLRIAELLIHSPDIPAPAREALRAASAATAEQREAQLTSAANILFRETDLDCADARELVGLRVDGACSCG